MSHPYYPTTIRQELSKLFATNGSASSITPVLVPTTTEPTGDGVLSTSWAGDGGSSGNSALLAFYGTRSSADNETFTARVTVWKKQVSTVSPTPNTTLWVPVPLLALSLTQGTSVGVAGADAVATEYFADTITASTAFTSAYEIISPADNTIAFVKVDFCGCYKLQVQLAKGTNATCNALGCMF